MADDAVLSRLDISQSGRWYRYRWQGEPPLAPARIVRSSANMHMIPSDTDVARALRQVRAGDRVRIEGWLVEATEPDRSEDHTPELQSLMRISSADFCLT